MKKLLLLLLACPTVLSAQVNITSWIMNLNGKKGSYWANTAMGGPPNYVFTISPDSADVLKVCYTADSIWVRAQGLTDNMGKYLNPGYCYAQNYVFRFPRNPVVAATKVTSPKQGSIGALLNGVPIYGLSNANSWNGTANVAGPGGLGIWNVEVGLSEGFVLDTAFGAHPQQAGAYHTHVTPFRFYRTAPAGQHSPLVGFAFDGYPVYGPYGYTNPTDATSGVTRMKSGYSLRSITNRHTLPYGVALTTAQYGPDVNATYPIGTYCEDYEWLLSNGGDLDKYNGRFCKTPEYPSGTYAYFVTANASGAAVFPYYIGIEYYGVPDQGNFGMVHLTMPASATTCIQPVTNGVENVLASGNGFTLYPNPTSGNITLQITDGLYTDLVIYNAMGAAVLTRSLSTAVTELSINFAPGVYFVKCRNNTTGAVEVNSFIVR
ncbi:MAG: YHYH protein [Bacteroidota bacterium]